MGLRELIMGLSGHILGLGANFGSKRVDFRPGRANFWSDGLIRGLRALIWA